MSDQPTCRHCGKTRAEHQASRLRDVHCHVDPIWWDPVFTPGPTYDQLSVALRAAEEQNARLCEALEWLLRIDEYDSAWEDARKNARAALTPPPEEES